jgi:RND family efflux transporter MFP subunit
MEHRDRWDVFFGVGLRRCPAHFDIKRCPHASVGADHVSRLSATWADLDVRGEDEPRKPHESIEQALSLVTLGEPAADIAVCSGVGLHAYWTLSRPTHELARIEGVNRALRERFSADNAVDAARINLVSTQVLSPITGRSGRTLVTEGALVTSGQQGPRATVQQLDPIYVDITQSSTEMLRLQRQLANGELVKDESNQAEVSLTLEDGSRYPERGRLKVSEASVDPSTGSVVLRAVFPNPRRELLPGMFVRAQLSQGTRSAALMVPQRGVNHNPRGEATVLIVDKDEKVAERVVTADRTIGDEWLITAGLSPGDRVIVDGLQKAKPGSPVKAVPAAEEMNADMQAGGTANDVAKR